MRTNPWIALLMAACGTPATTPDAGTADAAVVHDAAQEPVIVAVQTRGGVPIEDVRVYFQDADSTVVSSQLTNAFGEASVVMDPGGFVTAVRSVGGGSDEYALTTWSGVQPGDQLRLAGENDLAEVTFDVTIPTETDALGYRLSTPCGSADLSAPGGMPATTTESVSFTGCPANVDIIVTAEGADGVTLKFFRSENVAIADATPLTLTGTYEDLTPATLDFTNANFEMGAERWLLDGNQVVYRADAEIVESPPTASATALHPGTTGFSMATQSVVSTDEGVQIIVEWGPLATTYALDVGAALVRGFATAPGLDAATRTVSWTAGVMGNAPEVSAVDVVLERAASSTTWTWSMVAPAGTAMEFPSLPSDIFDFNPVATDTVSSVSAANIIVPGGYDGLRERFYGLSGFEQAIEGPTGRLAFVGSL